MVCGVLITGNNRLLGTLLLLVVVNESKDVCVVR